MTIALYLLAWAALSVPGLLYCAHLDGQLKLYTALLGLFIGPLWTLAACVVMVGDITLWRRED